VTTSLRHVGSPHTVALCAVLLVLTLALGAYAGLRAPWGTKHPQVKQGIAMRANTENDLVMFDADDGTQLTLDADSIWWESDDVGGEGNPPCLRKPHKKSDVEVGFLWVAGPSGGARPEGLWVKCL
jgi:hypothetical protein